MVSANAVKKLHRGVFPLERGELIRSACIGGRDRGICRLITEDLLSEPAQVSVAGKSDNAKASGKAVNNPERGRSD